jgi:hypothetical protein
MAEEFEDDDGEVTHVRPVTYQARAEPVQRESYTDTDGIVMEWDFERQAYFPKVRGGMAQLMGILCSDITVVKISVLTWRALRHNHDKKTTVKYGSDVSMGIRKGNEGKGGAGGGRRV